MAFVFVVFALALTGGARDQVLWSTDSSLKRLQFWVISREPTFPGKVLQGPAQQPCSARAHIRS